MEFTLTFINDKQGFIILSQFCQPHGLDPLPDARRSGDPEKDFATPDAPVDSTISY